MSPAGAELVLFDVDATLLRSRAANHAAVLEVWRRLFGGREALDIPFFVRQLVIDFRRPISLDDEVQVWIRVGAIKGASFTFEYLVEANEAVAAEAVTQLACVDNRSGRPVPIDPEVRATLETLQA